MSDQTRKQLPSPAASTGGPSPTRRSTRLSGRRPSSAPCYDYSVLEADEEDGEDEGNDAAEPEEEELSPSPKAVWSVHQLKLLRVMKQGMGSSVRNSEISDALGNAFNASECASKWKELKEADKRRLAEAGRELGPSPESPAKKKIKVTEAEVVNLVSSDGEEDDDAASGGSRSDRISRSPSQADEKPFKKRKTSTSKLPQINQSSGAYRLQRAQDLLKEEEELNQRFKRDNEKLDAKRLKLLEEAYLQPGSSKPATNEKLKTRADNIEVIQKQGQELHKKKQGTLRKERLELLVAIHEEEKTQKR